MGIVIAIAVGGAVGSVLRHFVNLWAERWFGGGFPWGTLAVNIAGSFVLGALVGLLAFRADMPAHWRALIGVGFCGGLTTFSTFSMDAVLLVERGQWALAAAYVAASVILALGAFALGLMAFKAAA
jgi:fluoride exporter